MAAPIQGKVEFQTAGGTTVMSFDPDTRQLQIFEAGTAKVVASFGPQELLSPALKVGKVGAHFHSLTSDGVVRFGTHGAIGTLGLRSNHGRQTIRLFAEMAECQLGGNGLDGHLMLHPATANNPDSASKAIIHLSAISAMARVGGNGKSGNISVRDEQNMSVVRIDGKGDINVGGDGKGGDIALFSSDAKNPTAAQEAVIWLSADNARISVGGNGRNGTLSVVNANNKPVVQIDGAKGDILLENADCAEDFDVNDPDIEPGSVLVLSDEPGRLRLSDAPYDTRVAGILSGAGDYRPAIVLDRQPGLEGRRPVALVGKAWCKVEARSAPIGVGSLLTTSSLPGHAMAATDRGRAFGAVLGKALAPLAAGVGVVPVLVALQ